MVARKRNKESLFQEIVLALKGMPDHLRSAFVLRHYQGLSPAEAAERMGVGLDKMEFWLKEADTEFWRRLRSPVKSDSQPGSVVEVGRDEVLAPS